MHNIDVSDDGNDLDDLDGNDKEGHSSSCWRWQCDDSQVPGTLHEWIEQHRVECAERLRAYLAIAEHMQSHGGVFLTEASEIFLKNQGPELAYNSKRFREKLLAVLPVRAVSSSRKTGWILIPRDGHDSFQGFSVALKHIHELQENLSLRNQFTCDDYAKMEQVMTSTEKLLCRTLLSEIYGEKETKKRFKLHNLKLAKRKVDATQLACTTLSTSGQFKETKNKKLARKELEAAPRGGRKPWESNAEAVKAVTDFVHARVWNTASFQKKKKV
jgi:hypothetical protein